MNEVVSLRKMDDQEDDQMKIFSYTPRLVFTILLTCLLLVSGCSGIGGQPTPTEPVESEGDFDTVISATGVVVPADWVTLSFSTSGIIEEILVKENDAVTEGDTLLQLEGQETLGAAISAANFELQSAQQALDSLFDDPELRSAQASQAIVDAEQAIKDCQQRVDNLLTSSDPDDVDQAKANLVLAKDKLDKALEEYNPYDRKPEDNLVRAALLSKVAQARKEYEAAQRLVNNLLGDANELDLAEAEANLALAEAQLVTAKRDFENLKDGPDPEDIALAEARVENARIQLDATQASLEDLSLVAPFAGTVSELNVRESEWLIPGQPVLTIADLNHLQVETTDLNEIDVARIQVGDPVLVTFDALPGVEIPGEIVRIASKASPGAGVNYKAIVELTDLPEALKWGMTAFVDIKLDQ
jgi:multidrug efflux pump subunit AcrA (membrane-fusion protein)